MFLNRGGVSADTLTNDTPLQAEWRVYETTNNLRCLAVRLYNGTGAAMVAGRVYRIAFDGDEETNPSAVACVTLASVYQNVVVALEDTAAASWGWFAIQGYCDAFVEGTTDVAKDDFLTCNDATDDDAFIDDTTARTVNSFAIACAAQADNSAVLTRVYLFGDRAILP